MFYIYITDNHLFNYMTNDAIQDVFTKSKDHNIVILLHLETRLFCRVTSVDVPYLRC